MQNIDVYKDEKLIGYYCIDDGMITVTSQFNGKSTTTQASSVGENAVLARLMLSEPWVKK